jgi:hypothetical protein
MAHFARRGVRWGLVLGALLATCSLQRARADETETRQFVIHVDGKPAGQYLMTITKGAGGVETMTAQASVRVRVLIKTYEYSYQGTEQWKGGRLQQLQSNANDDGTRYSVQAVPEGDALRVTVNGQTRMTKRDAWPTTHWKLRPKEYHNHAVTLMDADTGKEISGFLQYIGIQQLPLGGQSQNCYHFRVTGGPSPVDLWYDGDHRLVRQEFTVDGHRTAFYLTSLRRQ